MLPRFVHFEIHEFEFVEIFTLFIQFAPWNNQFEIKIVSLTPKMLKNVFSNDLLLHGSENHTNNFADTSFGPDYWTLLFTCVFLSPVTKNKN